MPRPFFLSRFASDRLFWFGQRPEGQRKATGEVIPEDSYELDETTRDGDTDVVLHFRARQSGIAVGDVEACVKGQFTDPSGDIYKFFGCDEIKVVPE